MADGVEEGFYVNMILHVVLRYTLHQKFYKKLHGWVVDCG
jgi:hypothetical protein